MTPGMIFAALPSMGQRDSCGNGNDYTEKQDSAAATP
jgi:hypothetical protein